MTMGYGEWNDTKYSLPDEGVRVLIFVDGNVQVAKLVKGISEKEREKMKNGEMPDDFCELWSKNKVISARRSEIYRKGDVFGNNLVPYEWEACGFPRDWRGQEVTHWMQIPDPPMEYSKRDKSGNDAIPHKGNLSFALGIIGSAFAPKTVEEAEYLEYLAGKERDKKLP